MRNWFLTAALALAVAAPAWGAQLTAGWRVFDRNELYRSAQAFKCSDGTRTDEAGDGISDGETCAATDHSPALDCRGTRSMEVHAELHAGTITVKLWNCKQPLGIGINANIQGIGADEAPANADTAADPEPLCVDITVAEGVTVDGNTVKTLATRSHMPHYLVAEVDACAACDATVFLSCSQ